MPEREEERRSSEGEQKQDKASQELALSASGEGNEGTPASSLELDLPRVRGVLGECGGTGKSGTPGDRKRGLSNLSNSTFDGRRCTAMRMMRSGNEYGS